MNKLFAVAVAASLAVSAVANAANITGAGFHFRRADLRQMG